MEVNSRIFGLAGVKKASDPARMLEQAASVMKARIEQLESRAAEQRAEAARLVKLNQKGPALRALKKAKQLESSIAANSASLDAVEQQVDLLAQAAVQQTLTSALETTSKSMKGSKAMVSRAEKAVDDVQEVRDMAEDLNTAISELTSTSNDVDDDELQMELEAMVEGLREEEVEVGERGGGRGKGKGVDDEEEDERKTLNSVASSSSSSSVSSRLMKNLPSVPRKKAVIEKAALLQNDAQALPG